MTNPSDRGHRCSLCRQRHLGSTHPKPKLGNRKLCHPPGKQPELSLPQKAVDSAASSAEREGRCDYPRRLPQPAGSAIPGGAALATGRGRAGGLKAL